MKPTLERQEITDLVMIARRNGTRDEFIHAVQMALMLEDGVDGKLVHKRLAASLTGEDKGK